MALLELENVEARYGPIRALHGVSLSVEEGQAVSLLGANGAGKTTTLRSISGPVRSTGAIAFASKRIAGRAPESIARLGIAHVPEGRGIYAELTVWENVLLGGAARRERRGGKRGGEGARPPRRARRPGPGARPPPPSPAPPQAAGGDPFRGRAADAGARACPRRPAAA